MLQTYKGNESSSICCCVCIQMVPISRTCSLFLWGLPLSLQNNTCKYFEIIAHSSEDPGSCCHNYQSLVTGKYLKEDIRNSPTSQRRDGPLSRAPSPAHPTSPTQTCVQTLHLQHNFVLTWFGEGKPLYHLLYGAVSSSVYIMLNDRMMCDDQRKFFENPSFN
jgi:hypothetical protein